MLARRISRYTPDDVEVRLARCNRMLRVLERALARQQSNIGRNETSALGPYNIGQILPGTHAYRHTLWLFPVMVPGGSDIADRVVEDLLREGFDATRAPTSLIPVSR